MTKILKKQSILDAVHETAKGLYDAGIMDQITMQEFDDLCLQSSNYKQNNSNDHTGKPIIS